MSDPAVTTPVENMPIEDAPTNSSPVKRVGVLAAKRPKAPGVGRGKAPTTMAANTLDADMVNIVITADHVYLPLGDDGNVVPAWTVPNVLTRKVLRRTHLQVPADLARFLSDRDQAEITDAAVAIAEPTKVSP